MGHQPRKDGAIVRRDVSSLSPRSIDMLRHSPSTAGCMMSSLKPLAYSQRVDRMVTLLGFGPFRTGRWWLDHVESCRRHLIRLATFFVPLRGFHSSHWRHDWTVDFVRSWQFVGGSSHMALSGYRDSRRSRAHPAFVAHMRITHCSCHALRLIRLQVVADDSHCLSFYVVSHLASTTGATRRHRKLYDPEAAKSRP